MAHQNQINFCKWVKANHPRYFKDVSVCDIGSLDINGNNHYLFENYKYAGVDVGVGKNVTVISEGHNYKPEGVTYDIVISTECFEHDKNYRATLLNCIALLKSGGMFLFTCATTGRHEHGTRRTRSLETARENNREGYLGDSPLTAEMGDWGDYYKNLTEQDIREVFAPDEHFSESFFGVDNNVHDLYFFGIKK